MNFLRSGKDVFGVKLNKAEQKAIDEEIKRQIVEKDKEYSAESEAIQLWILHEFFGFGKGRLRKYWELINTSQKELRERYILDEGDTPWLCKEQLKGYGIDIDEWLKEEE